MAIAMQIHAQSSKTGWLAEIKPELNFHLGSNTLAKTAPGLDKQFSPGIYVDLRSNFALSKDKIYLSTGLGYHGGLFILDGYFHTQAGANVFSTIPDTYKLNELVMGSIEIPALLRLLVWGTGTNGLAVSPGAYIAYLVQKKHRYKAGNARYDEKFLVDNPFQWGVIFDVGTIGNGNSGKRPGASFGFGLKYQVSNFLGSSRSFNPLLLYLRIGISK